MQSAPILIVDDDPNIRGLVAEALDWEGYRVATAANGAEALKLVESKRPALVLLDMQMPMLDGPGLMQTLRQRGWRIPIIVLTAASNAQRYAMELAADGFVPKPFDLAELLDVVARLYNRAQPARASRPGSRPAPASP